MTLKEAMQNLDAAIDEAKLALYSKDGCKTTADERMVYNAMMLKLGDLRDLMRFVTKGAWNEHGDEDGKSPFKG